MEIRVGKSWYYLVNAPEAQNGLAILTGALSVQ